jgi:hypothetical protein
MSHPRRQRESGFALLLVFLMASVIAISLYMELPRVAFDAQRQKEQLLIDRGEQYKRAIKVFYNTNKRYPASIEELETLNNKHSLRKRYKDPMTGKDEWRVIHVQNGVLTDSKVVQPQKGAQQAQSSTAGQYVPEMSGFVAAPLNNGTPGVNVAQRRRASDDRPAGLGDAGVQGNPTDPNANPGQPGIPGQTPGQIPGQQFPGQQLPGQQAGQFPGQQMPGQQQFPGQQVPGQLPFPGQPGAVQTGQLPPNVGIPGGIPGQQISGFPGVGRGGQVVTVPPTQNAPANNSFSYANAGGSYAGGGSYIAPPVNSQTGGASPIYNPAGVNGTSPYGTAPGSNGTPPAFGQPGMNTAPNQSPAIGMINSILTTPRAPTGTAVATSPMGQVIGGGIAGFASVADQEGIKTYGDRTNYGEWEFIFDLNKDNIPPANPLGGSVGTPVNQMSNQNGIGTSGLNPGSTPPPQLPGQTPPGQMPGMNFGPNR